MHSHRKISNESKKIDQEPLITPIYQSSTFIFPDTASLIAYQKGEAKAYLYTRYGNPTIESAAKRMAELDKSESSLVLASGMAAISTACLTLLSPGDELISSFPIYGGTANLFNNIFKRLKIKVNYFPSDDLEAMAKLVNSKTKVIYLESPTNPNLKIIDLKAAASFGQKKKIMTLIDSTFATPINQRPIEFGIDVVIHSATKYLGGHSDIIGGVISGSSEFIRRSMETMKLFGGCADPHQAFLLERGLKTLWARMRIHNENAIRIAEFLDSEPGIERVIYPSLESHPQHRLALDQMSGFGGIVSVDLGTEARAIKFADSLRVFKNAVSLGGVESLISIPIWTSHMGLDRNELAKSGVTPGLVRLSVGIEDSDLLIEDIKNSLEKLN